MGGEGWGVTAQGGEVTEPGGGVTGFVFFFFFFMLPWLDVVGSCSWL